MNFQVIALATSLIVLTGCQNIFSGGETYELSPITFENTEYTVYERVRSTNATVDHPRNDPDATRAVYVRVGQGATVYCGPTVAGCEAAIRRFNQGQQSSEEMY